MKQSFLIQNVKCGGCANTLKTKLRDEFGEIEVDLNKTPREIILDIESDKIKLLRKALISLGYPMVDEDLGFIDTTSTKAKSFVSCAVGKFEISKGVKDL
jgi:copper chaperone CopZ